MTDEITVDGIRELTEEEKELEATFLKWRVDSIATLDEAAKQIIGLVGTFFGVIFGVLALGSDTFAIALNNTVVMVLGTLAALAFVAALLAASWTILPSSFFYREHSLTDKKRIFDELLAQKSNRLYGAYVCFGIGAVAFALLVIVMLWLR